MVLGIQAVDIVCILIIVLSVTLGIMKGFIREILSLFFLGVAIILSFLYYDEISRHFFEKIITNRATANFLSFISIWLIILTTGFIVTFYIKKHLNLKELKHMDRILGGVLGLIKGLALIVFLAFCFAINGQMPPSRLLLFLQNTINQLI